MSEKRFFCKINKNGRLIIIDKECHIEIIDLTLACEVLNRLDLKLKTYNEQLGEQQATIKKQEEIIKSQDMEISRQYNLCLAMSGVLRGEFGVYDVFDRSKDKKVK